MSDSKVKSFHLKQPDGDEVEKSIEFLDKVLSEFEDPDSLPHIEQEPQEPETPTQGNQSEDDGYMSMNGKRELKLTDDITDNQSRSKKPLSDAKIRCELPNINDSLETVPSLTTLPKARPLNVNPSKYASLPCSTQSKNITVDADPLAPGRNRLGIDISAVHDAVIRGITRIPETIINEHPVTIYPGRSSPTKNKSSTNRNSSVSSYNMKGELLHLDDNVSSESEVNDDDIDEKCELSGSAKNETTSLECPYIDGPMQQSIRISNIIKCQDKAPAEDEFSDDSLENDESSDTEAEKLYPLPLEKNIAIVPKKCTPGIAWEIKLYEKDELNVPLISNNLILIGSNLNDCENSVTSTPCNSILSTEQSFSSDWPDPPEIPICSTEDEAGSIITDSEDVLPIQTTIIPKTNGTFIIKKRRERKPVFDLPELVNPTVKVEFDHEADEVKESQEVLNIEETYEILQKSMMQPQMNVPKYRHSIDLAKHTPMHTEYNSFWSKSEDIQIRHAASLTPSKQEYFTNKDCNSNKSILNDDLNIPLMRVASLPIITQPPVSNSSEVATTPRRDLAPPIEEDEEPESEAAPLRQIENNISALLRGDIPIARVTDIQPPRRPMGFRSGVHKSESAKEMLLSQHMFGPLPSPPSSSADEIDGLPPLPPLPSENNADVYWADGTGHRSTSIGKNIYENRYRDSIDVPPVPPHRYPLCENTLKTMSMDPKYYKSTSPHTPGSTRSHDRMPLSSSRKRMPGSYIKHTTPSPHEERRLQTSCSLPETPIFARGCDVPRTPHRRAQELPTCGGSRTAPRPMNSLNSSIVGIAGSTLNGRQPQRSINHALLSSEMLRITGGPGRGWYPKQRQSRPVSNENLDRIQGGGRAWDTNSANRKPLTLPPNLSPNFFKRSPTDALRRVTSLLIRKGNSTKEAEKKERVNNSSAHRPLDSGTLEHRNTTQKKRGFFKSLWKKTKHYSIEQ